MTVFSHITKQEFLTTVWQKKPYVFRQAFTDIDGMFDGNDLAGLACEESVESRIIKGFELSQPWICSQGPFTEDDFAELPDKNWTLLVQGVEQWSEEAQQLLEAFSFLPHWRLEDLMASYAPKGGGVGPHFDYYDVFLIQLSGSREWRLGQQCDEATVLKKDSAVKLLEAFENDAIHEIHAGDMLYIPAGKAHWGVASSDDCITLSVGFRAPSATELLSTALDHVINNLPDSQRYKDTLASIDTDPFKINKAVHQQLESVVAMLTPDVLKAAVEHAFGELVTEPRHSSADEVDEITEELITSVLRNIQKNDSELILHRPPHTRIAYSGDYLYLNGETYSVPESLAKAVCDGSISTNLLEVGHVPMITDWLNQGDLIMDEDCC